MAESDHAEYTLIERKCRDQNLTGAVLFATLEPCAPGARKSPKLSCAERITNARIAKVFYGIEDPDPTVSGKGCSHLKANGVEVALFDRDLQDEIRACNTEFLNAANERSLLAKEEPKKIKAAEGSLDAPVKNCTLEMLDAELVHKGILADEQVTVEVFAVNGVSMGTYTTTYAEAKSAFYRLPLQSGVYILRIRNGKNVGGALSVKKY